MYHVVCYKSTTTCFTKRTICKYAKSSFFATTKTHVTKPKTSLDDVSKQFNITQMSDWYKLTSKVSRLFERNPTIKDFENALGSQFETKHNSSPSQLLSSVYPEYDWLPWKFDKSPQGFWSDVKNQRKFMEWAAKELKITEMNDWYHISNQVHFYFFKQFPNLKQGFKRPGRWSLISSERRISTQSLVRCISRIRLVAMEIRQISTILLE
jgi:hypothetical protein